MGNTSAGDMTTPRHIGVGPSANLRPNHLIPSYVRMIPVPMWLAPHVASYAENAEEEI